MFSLKGVQSLTNLSTLNSFLVSKQPRGQTQRPLFRTQLNAKSVFLGNSLSNSLQTPFLSRSMSFEKSGLGKRSRRDSPVQVKAVSQEVPGSTPHEVGATVRIRGLTTIDHFFTVPLDHSGEVPGTVKVFAREVVATNRASLSPKQPMLVFFQGGPGFESPRPSDCGGWIGAAAEKFRILLLDQRGVGRSSPKICAAALERIGGPQEQADYLKFFRADSIVKDAELIRKVMLPNGDKWTTLGQSFGGFCTLSYLSFAPEGLERCLITGGLAPITSGSSADEVYRHTYQRVKDQNIKFYERFPQHVETVQNIVKAITKKGGQVPLPTGGVLSTRGLQWIGISLGFSGGFESLHYLFENALDEEGELTHYFLRGYENMISVDTNPIFAILHEPIYNQGAASNWSAHRVRTEDKELNSLFDAESAVQENRPVYLTGEMIYPWMFDEVASLRPMKEAANILAEKTDWPALYNTEVLKNNTVPVAAAAYYEDMYVDFILSEKAAAGVKGLRMWVTSEYMHSGVREDGPRIFNRLLAMTDDEIPIR